MFRRVALLAVTITTIFGVVAAVMLRVLPGPRTDSDYLVSGAVATLAAMLALFLILISGWVKAPDVFFKRREKRAPDAEGSSPPE